MARPVSSRWADLFAQALKIVDQVNATFTLLDDWSFGGGTALMLQIDHRESFDVDIFIGDAQVLPYLNPQTQGYTLDVNPDGYISDGTHTLKIAFDGIGEIDFIVAPRLTSASTATVEVCGRNVLLETPAEIVAKKIFYRGKAMQPRDMFDIACVRQELGDEYLINALFSYRSQCADALDAARRMDPLFAQEVMKKLLYRERFKEVPAFAREATMKLLEAVCRHDPTSE